MSQSARVKAGTATRPGQNRDQRLSVPSVFVGGWLMAPTSLRAGGPGSPAAGCSSAVTARRNSTSPSASAEAAATHHRREPGASVGLAMAARTRSGSTVTVRDVRRLTIAVDGAAPPTADSRTRRIFRAGRSSTTAMVSSSKLATTRSPYAARASGERPVTRSPSALSVVGSTSREVPWPSSAWRAVAPSSATRRRSMSGAVFGSSACRHTSAIAPATASAAPS